MYPAERGAGGFKLETGLNNNAFWCLTALEDAVVTVNSIRGTDNSIQQYTSLPIPAGVTIYGNFTACNVVSGTVWGYPGSGG